MAVKVIPGDCRETIKTIPDNSIDCCVTSPPYWGLRDYGVDGQIGLEPTMQEYLATMVEVFRDVRRVLKPEGTCWLNIGDSYAANTKGSGGAGKSTLGPNKDLQNIGFQKFEPRKFSLGQLKPKDLCMIPNRLAILLQEDGWYVRSEIIWHKPNPMPESVRDRPTSAHEKVWLLTKNERYYYDAAAIQEEGSGRKPGNKSHKYDGLKGHETKAGFMAMSNIPQIKRNARNVWGISPKPFKGAHFATMPPDLAERCIKAGCPKRGTVLDPFFGAGTTGLAANRLNRNCIGLEANQEYISIAKKRIREDAPLMSWE